MGEGGQILAFYADPKGTWASFLVQFFSEGLHCVNCLYKLVGILWLFVSTKSLFFSLLDPDVIYQRFSVQVLLRIYLGRNHA